MNKNITKEMWGEGPWQHEPDISEFIYKGHYCLLSRNPGYGNWRGYVAIDPTSKFANENYNSINLSIHGGITYGSFSHPLLNIPKDYSLFWIGFDCRSGRTKPGSTAYSVKDYEEDYAPGEKLALKRIGFLDSGNKEFYRTIEFARNELKQLVDQIIDPKSQE